MVARDVLAGRLVVEFEDGRRIIIAAADVLSVEPRSRGQRRPEAEADDEADSDAGFDE